MDTACFRLPDILLWLRSDVPRTTSSSATIDPYDCDDERRRNPYNLRELGSKTERPSF